MKKLLITLLITGCTVIASKAVDVLYGTADLDGNGSLETIYTNSTQVRVVAGAGSVSRTYTFQGSIAVLTNGVQDLDGVAGAEIAISQLIPGPITSTTPLPTMQIITHKTGVVKVYTMTRTWKLLPNGIRDMDGLAGAEIATFDVLPDPNPAWTGSEVVITTQRTGVQKHYDMNGSHYATWQLLANGIQDLDGIAGAEIAIQQFFPDWNGYHPWDSYELVVITHKAGTITRYNTGNANTWSLLTGGVTDLDGVAGAEIAIKTYHPNATVPSWSWYEAQVWNQNTKTMRSYVLRNSGRDNWNLCPSGIANIDGVAGAEIKVSYVTASYGGETITHRTQSVAHKTVGCQ